MSYFKKKIDVWGRVVREFISKGVVFNNCIIVNSYLELLHTSIPQQHVSLVLLQSLVGKHLNHFTGKVNIKHGFEQRNDFVSNFFVIPLFAGGGKVLSPWNISGRSTPGVWVSKQKMRKYPRVLTQGFLGPNIEISIILHIICL